MKQEVGRTHSDVFQEEPSNIDETRPKLEVKDATRSLDPGPTLRWRFVKSTTPIEKDVPLIELNGEIGFQKDYCADPDNLWADLSSPLPFVFFHPILPLYIDTRKEGSLARYVRRSCKPNAQLDTYLSSGSEYHFWLVSDRFISANEQITLPWDFRLDKTVCPRWLHLLGLSDDDATSQDEPEMDDAEYRAISNWIDRILSEYGGCACDLDNNCAFARFHRHYLFCRNHARPVNGKKKQRKPRTHTISPTSTGHATNSRAASEGNADEQVENDGRDDTGSSRSKPTSRDPTPLRQGSFDQLGILTEPTDRDKRKVAMVEDSFRRMEQQQPPRKKKRLSDGTTTSNSSTKTKSRGSVTATRGQYVDTGTSRSKSGSPASIHSPSFSNVSKPSLSKQDSTSTHSRQASVNPRPVYCDASVQTDPVEGEWFSDPAKSPKPRKRIISLSKRLLNSRYRYKAHEDEHKSQCETTSPASSSQKECSSSPTIEQTPTEPRPVTDTTSPVIQDTPAETLDGDPPIKAEPSASVAANKASELRVQLPPVPAFDNSTPSVSSVTTPLSTASSIVQSPLFSNNPTSPFPPLGVNGTTMAPSPVKKKLSLSDYTKSRMNKSSGKVAGGTALLKAGLASPDDIKTESIMESPSVEKSEDVLTPTTATAPALNGVV
jgi:hypothetical protein